MNTRVKKILLAAFLIAVNTGAFDFSRYTLINKETKDFLRANWLGKSGDSTYKSGVLSLFGNSLTIESEFWENVPKSRLGAVPGTDTSTYDLKCAGYGSSIWDTKKGCIAAGLDRINPEVILIMYGTNESLGAPRNADWSEWQTEYSDVLDSLLIRGMIPIISTIPPLFDQMDSTHVPTDTNTPGVNRALRELAKKKKVVLSDYHQAVVDYTQGNPFTSKWYDDNYVHPSMGCEPDTVSPQCGYGIRNAVCWWAFNKVYRIIVENGEPDTGSVAALGKIVFPKKSAGITVEFFSNSSIPLINTGNRGGFRSIEGKRRMLPAR